MTKISGYQEITIPFGPYKNRSVREVAFLNLQYLKTLVLRHWFHEQYKNDPCYQLIISYAGTDARETPAHNALQARFLDDDFSLAVFHVAISLVPENFEEKIANQIAEDKRRRLLKIDMHKSRIDFILKRLYSSIERLEAMNDYERRCGPLYAVPPTRRRRIEEAKRADEEFIREDEEAIRAEKEAIDRAATSQYVFRPLKDRGFEDKGDVSLSISVELSQRPDISAVIWRKKKIEIKTQVGDEYPDYLRKMRIDGSEFMLVQTFKSRSITREQFVQIFANSGKHVIFLDAVEKRMLAPPGPSSAASVPARSES